MTRIFGAPHIDASFYLVKVLPLIQKWVKLVVVEAKFINYDRQRKGARRLEGTHESLRCS